MNNRSFQASCSKIISIHIINWYINQINAAINRINSYMIYWSRQVHEFKSLVDGFACFQQCIGSKCINILTYINSYGQATQLIISFHWSLLHSIKWISRPLVYRSYCSWYILHQIDRSCPPLIQKAIFMWSFSSKHIINWWDKVYN